MVQWMRLKAHRASAQCLSLEACPSVTWSYCMPYLHMDVLRIKTKNSIANACFCRKHLTTLVPVVKANA